MKTLVLAARAVLYACGFFVFWGWLDFAARRFDHRLGGELPAWTPWLGLPLLVAGATWSVACVATFVVRGRGTPAPFDPPREFVAVGPYRVVRNPMYLGAFVGLLGLGLITRSPSMVLFVLVPATCAALFVRFVEEPQLERRFGASYRAYKQSVPRWLPRRRRARR